MKRNRMATTAQRPELAAHGVRLGEQVVPLLAGSVHYYHLEVEHWASALKALAELGLRFVDTYVPWSLHEHDEGYDFGSVNPQLDVAGFIRLAGELGLYAIIRPGPHVNAELTRFGLPERVVWDETCMARSASGARVVLPMPPLAFPLPSYASHKFIEEASAWYHQVGRALAGLCYPDGPIVLVQVDNEAAMSFRDGVFDQDYHPDAIATYRQFLERKYPNLDELRRLYKNPALVIGKANPPRSRAVKHATELAPFLDWAESQETMLASSLERLASTLRSQFPGALLSHNLPPGFEYSVLDPARLDAVVDLLGLDYSHRANTAQLRAIGERTSELRVRANSARKPCFAAELGVGFPPYFSPHSEVDSRFTALSALAYGVQGFNIYMAVERSRWIGAPILADGTKTSEAAFYRDLVGAVTRTRLAELERSQEVTIVVPRDFRRLCRVLNAFGPLSPTLLSAMSGDGSLGPSEKDLGLPSSVVMDTLQFLELIENELDSHHVQYGIATLDRLPHVLDSSRWVIVLCSSAMRTADVELLSAALHSGVTLTLGPHFPDRDEHFQVRPTPIRLAAAELGVPQLLGANPKAVARAVDSALDQLGLSVLQIDNPQIRGTLFESPAIDSRVAFLLNPTNRDAAVSWHFDSTIMAHDALSGAPLPSAGDTLTISIERRSARMLELTRIS
jgi:beta-galactosidase